MKFLKQIKVWQAYPGTIVAAITPWVEPFRKIGLINKHWQPEVDIFVDAVIVFYILYLMLINIQKKSKSYLVYTFKKCSLIAIFCAALIYFIKSYFIHKIDADIVLFVEIVWVLAYVAFFVAIVSMVFVGLLSLRNEPN